MPLKHAVILVTCSNLKAIFSSHPLLPTEFTH
jgi:hypothetical protein